MSYAKKDKFDYDAYLKHNRTQTIFKEFGEDWINNNDYLYFENLIKELYDTNPEYIGNKVKKIVHDNSEYHGKNNGYGQTIGALLVAHKHFDKEIEKLKRAKIDNQKKIKERAKLLKSGNKVDYTQQDAFVFDLKIDYGDVQRVFSNERYERIQNTKESFKTPNIVKQLGNDLKRR